MDMPPSVPALGIHAGLRVVVALQTPHFVANIAGRLRTCIYIHIYIYVYIYRVSHGVVCWGVG